MRKTVCIYITAAFITVILLSCGHPLFSQIDVKEMNIDTGGDTRGIALRGYYAFLADGSRGLKIVNMSSRLSFKMKGNLLLPESFVEQVAVDGDTVVLTDTKKERIHFVDVWDTGNPQLKATLKTKGDIPRAVAAEGGMAFVVEFGDNPAAPGYFTGLEIFAYEKKIKSIQLLKIRSIRDIAAAPKFVYAAGANRVMIFQRSPSGVVSKPIAKVSLLKGENIDSLALCEQWLFAFGQKNLYAVYIGNPFNPKISDLVPVPGDPDCRKVDAAILDYGGGTTSDPNIMVLLTTLKTYGMFSFYKPAQKLNPFSMYDVSTSKVFSFRDVHKASDGKVKIYDSAFSRYFYPGAFSGGTFALGAVGAYGMAFVQVDKGF